MDEGTKEQHRAMRARLGPQQATVATAHKSARVVYHLLKHCDAFQADSVVAYQRKRRERELQHLTRHANKFGYTLLPAAAQDCVKTPNSGIFARASY